MASAFTLPEAAKIVNLLAPAADAAGRTSAYVSLKNYHKAYIVVHMTQGNAATVLLSPLQATAVAGTGSKAGPTCRIWANLDTATNDTLARATDAATYTTDAGVKLKIVVFEIDPSALDLGQLVRLHRRVDGRLQRGEHHRGGGVPRPRAVSGRVAALGRRRLTHNCLTVARVSLTARRLVSRLMAFGDNDLPMLVGGLFSVAVSFGATTTRGILDYHDDVQFDEDGSSRRRSRARRHAANVARRLTDERDGDHRGRLARVVRGQPMAQDDGATSLVYLRG
jgi:hypothetical protein